MGRHLVCAFILAVGAASGWSMGAVIDDFSYRNPTVWPQEVTSFRNEFEYGTNEADGSISGGVRRANVYTRYFSGFETDAVGADVITTGDRDVLSVWSRGSAAPGLVLGWGHAAGDATAMGISKEQAVYLRVEILSLDSPGDWPLNIQATMYTVLPMYASVVSAPLAQVSVRLTEPTVIDFPIVTYWSAFPERMTLDGIGLRFTASTGASFQVDRVSVVVPEPSTLGTSRSPTCCAC